MNEEKLRKIINAISFFLGNYIENYTHEPAVLLFYSYGVCRSASWYTKWSLHVSVRLVCWLLRKYRHFARQCARCIKREIILTNELFATASMAANVNTEPVGGTEKFSK